MASLLRAVSEAGRGTKIGGVCGIISGVLILAITAMTALIPTSAFNSTQDLLIAFDQIGTLLNVVAGLFVALAIFATPFFVSMRRATEGRDGTLAAAASTLSIAGLITFAGFVLGFVGIFTSLASAYRTASPPDRATVVLITTAASGLFVVLGLVQGLVGAGLILFGIASQKGEIVPAWTGYVALAGGLFAFLALVPVPAVSFALFLLFFVLTLGWFLVAGFFLWRSGSRRAAV